MTWFAIEAIEWMAGDVEIQSGDEKTTGIGGYTTACWVGGREDVDVVGQSAFINRFGNLCLSPSLCSQARLLLSQSRAPLANSLYIHGRPISKPTFISAVL